MVVRNKKLIVALLVMLCLPKTASPIDPVVTPIIAGIVAVAVVVGLPVAIVGGAIIVKIAILGAIGAGTLTVANLIGREGWKNRPKAEHLEGELNLLKNRIDKAIKIIENNESPEIRKNIREATEDYEDKMSDLREKKEDKKISYIKYLIEKKKAKRSYNAELRRIESGRVYANSIFRRWEELTKRIWRSWTNYFRKAYEKLLSETYDFVSSVEKKAGIA